MTATSSNTYSEMTMYENNKWHCYGGSTEARHVNISVQLCFVILALAECTAFQIPLCTFAIAAFFLHEGAPDTPSVIRMGTNLNVFDLRPTKDFWGRHHRIYMMLDNPDSGLGKQTM